MTSEYLIYYGRTDKVVSRATVKKGTSEFAMKENIRENERPWGYFEVLSEQADHKVKRIVIQPGKRLSLQRHRHRSERWHVIRGRAMVTRGNEEIELGVGESVDIPCGVVHRVQNLGDEPLVLIEVQRGDYFGEDNIEWLEDDYGRI